MTEIATTPETHALSYSGLNDLLISALRYWYFHVWPERPKKEPTPSMIFGKAVHAAVLESEKFFAEYCQSFVAPEGALVTIQDIKAWITDKGEKPKGGVKAAIIDQAMAIDPHVPIADVLRAEHDAKNAGKIQFPPADWERLIGARDSLLAEPLLAEILADEDSMAEVSHCCKWEETNLKGFLDWETPTWTAEIKTFTTRGKRTLDQSVTQAIWYENYHRQGYFYSLLRSVEMKTTPTKAPRFLFAFVESDPPHEVRLREFRPREAGEVNMLWERARIDVANGAEMYREYMAEFGIDKPWRYAQKIDPLDSMEFPALAYGG